MNSKCHQMSNGRQRAGASRCAHADKSPWMWILVLASWAVIVGSLQRPLFLMLFGHPSALHRTLLLYFTCWLNFAWLYGVHQLAVVFCSSITRHVSHRPTRNVPSRSTVAILYTTMNDFSHDAALSCVKQTHPGCHVFLLDDSTEKAHKKLVDAFHAEHPFHTTVIRRPTRIGFKAGNLNYALEAVGGAYEFFAVCDADGILPSDFVSRVLQYFTDDSIGFVQAVQRPLRTIGTTRFACDLDTEVTIYWKRIVPAAERFGFVMFHGHGGMIRTGVWRKVGGFPQVVAEDLAFSTRASQLGYKGVIANDVVCYEDFPASYESFAKRHLKYARGACEHLQKEMWSFLCSPKVRWFEKADRLLASIAMVSALPLLLFILDWALLFSGVFGSTSNFGLLAAGGVPLRASHGARTSMIAFGWAFYLVMAAILLMPLAPAVCHLWRHPRSLARYLADSVGTHLSLIVDGAWEIIEVALFGKISFPVTGDRTSGGEFTEYTARVSFPPDLPTVIRGCVVPIALTLLCDLSILPISLATMAGVVVRGLGWEHRMARAVIPLPAVSLLILVTLGYPGLASGSLVASVSFPL